jgi:hypothetical protein
MMTLSSLRSQIERGIDYYSLYSIFPINSYFPFTFEYRTLLPSSPLQSNFRVFCLLVIESGGSYHLLEGTNIEQGYIGGFFLITEMNYECNWETSFHRCYMC